MATTGSRFVAVVAQGFRRWFFELREVVRYCPSSIKRGDWRWALRFAFTRLFWYFVPLLWPHYCCGCFDAKVPFPDNLCERCYERELMADYYPMVAGMLR